MEMGIFDTFKIQTTKRHLIDGFEILIANDPLRSPNRPPWRIVWR
jgi:hypothetical protein